MSVGGLERVDLQPSAAGEPPKLSLSQGAGAGVAGWRRAERRPPDWMCLGRAGDRMRARLQRELKERALGL